MFSLIRAASEWMSEALLRRCPSLYVYRTAVLYRLFPDRYTDANPLKVLRVDPNEVTGIVERSACPSELGRVTSGDWDQDPRKFSHTRIYRSISSRVLEGTPWEVTPLYRGLLDPPEDAIWQRAYDSETEVRERLNRVDELVTTIREEGYRTQRELLEERPEETKARNNDGVHPLFNEIRVVIGRDGELLVRRRGLHRLAIGQIVALDRIAVQVAVRHTKWQNVRNELRRNGPEAVDEELLDHPDLEELIE